VDLLQKFQKNWGGELTKEQYDIYIENRNHNPHKIDYLYRCLYTGAGEEYQLEGQFNCSIKELKELYPGVHHTQITLLKALFISLDEGLNNQPIQDQLLEEFKLYVSNKDLFDTDISKWLLLIETDSYEELMEG